MGTDELKKRDSNSFSSNSNSYSYKSIKLSTKLKGI